MRHLKRLHHWLKETPMLAIPALTTALTVSAIVACSSTAVTQALKAEAQPYTTCADTVNMINLKKVDEPLVRHYLNEACEIFEVTDAYTESPSDVDIIFLNTSQVMNICSPPGQAWLACTIGLGNKYTVIVPHGSPGLIRHEMLHVLMGTAGIADKDHHAIMTHMNIYWIGADE